MKLSEQIKKARELMEIEIPLTKSLYKSIDHYERKQRWLHREMMKEIKKNVERQMGINIDGVAKTE